MGMLQWLLHRDRQPIAMQKTPRIDDAIQRILAMNPRLQMARRFEERLTKAVDISMRYTDALTASLPSAHSAKASAWSSDPCMRAFFATPAELDKVFGRSETLRAFFNENPGVPEAYATLGMSMIERHVLGVAVEGDSVRHDVPQTTLWFGDHRIRMCGRSDAELRDEINHRLIDQLALQGLAKLAADSRKLLAQGRELRQERVALLARQGAGIRAVVGDGEIAEPDELDRVQTLIEENARSLAALRAPTKELDLELDGICEVMSNPAAHLFVEKRRIRLDLMNIVQEQGGPATHEIELNFAHIPGDPPAIRAVALVRYPREELPPYGLDIDAAMRVL